jgi:hypothetical protein
MTSAVIVSGVLREMTNAAASWQFKGDYFLHVDNNIVTPQSFDIIGSASETINHEIKNCSINFVSVTIDTDTSKKYTPEQILKYHWIERHAMLNMTWRWKSAFQQIKLYNKVNNYTKVLILRPDIYVHAHAPWDEYENLIPEDNVVYALAPIVPGDVDWRGYPTMGDVMLMANMATMEKFVQIYDFLLEHYEDTLYRNYDIHSIMARFVIENNIRVSGRLGELFSFAALRDNTRDMFENGRLKEQYAFVELQKKQHEWWLKKWNLKGS